MKKIQTEKTYKCLQQMPKIPYESQVFYLKEELSQGTNNRLLHGVAVFFSTCHLIVKNPKWPEQAKVSLQPGWWCGIKGRRKRKKIIFVTRRWRGLRLSCWEAISLGGNNAQQKLNGFQALVWCLFASHVSQALPKITQRQRAGTKYK